MVFPMVFPKDLKSCVALQALMLADQTPKDAEDGSDLELDPAETTRRRGAVVLRCCRLVENEKTIGKLENHRKTMGNQWLGHLYWL